MYSVSGVTPVLRRAGSAVPVSSQEIERLGSLFASRLSRSQGGSVTTFRERREKEEEWNRRACIHTHGHLFQRRHTSCHVCNFRAKISFSGSLKEPVFHHRVNVHTSSVILPWPPHSPPLFSPEAHRAKDGVSALRCRTEETPWRQRE